MNARFCHAVIAAVMLTVQLCGLTGMVAAAPRTDGAEPDCGMSCCAENHCECAPAPLAPQPQTAPALPVSVKSDFKCVPLAVAIVPAAVFSLPQLAVGYPCENACCLRGHAAPIFMRHCSLLI